MAYLPGIIHPYSGAKSIGSFVFPRIRSNEPVEFDILKSETPELADIFEMPPPSPAAKGIGSFVLTQIRIGEPGETAI